VPALFEQGHQEVQSCHDVGSKLLVSHVFGTDSDVQVGNLLELPLNGSLHIVDLLFERLGVSDWLWESTNSVKDWTENLWNLLNDGVGGEKKIILLGPLLDQLLVLVELLQVVEVGDLNV